MRQAIGPVVAAYTRVPCPQSYIQYYFFRGACPTHFSARVKKQHVTSASKGRIMGRCADRVRDPTSSDG